MLREAEEIRQRLDDVDDRMVAILAERFKYVDELAERKRVGGLQLRDEAREQELLQRVNALGRDAGISGSFVERIFREVLDHSVRRQLHEISERRAVDREAVTVAYQGIAGAFSHLAATRYFDVTESKVALQGYSSFREVVAAVLERTASYGMLPIENTTAGSINEVYDLLATSALCIVGEEVQTVNHCLLAIPGASEDQLRRIRSHPQALAQCSHYLRELNDCRAEAFEDTAAAARQVQLDGDPSEGAIASEAAAEHYGLQILKRDIANQKHNYTRFVVTARAPASYPSGIQCKTSVVFTVRHEVGALASCLQLLADRHLSLTKIESRPRPHSPWEYLFYLDFEGDAKDDSVADALRELAATTLSLKVLGSYPTLIPTINRLERSPPPDRSHRTSQSIDPVAVDVPRGSCDRSYKLASRASHPEDTCVTIGSVTIGRRPVVIAGPCAVESREQIMACARVVRQQGADLLRGGCFKPRTSPYDFQGLGLEGLHLLREAGDAFGLPVVTEVLHPADAERVAAVADVLQIGARNMQNFELLKAVGRLQCPVILKRGMMASIDEWLAAAEYILYGGNPRVILCERGIRTFETATRNTLDLAAVQVVRERSHLPIIVDPSHACGVARWVPPMAGAAIAAGAQGVMVEIHPQPEVALSDGPQSLRFGEFSEMMAVLNDLRDGRTPAPPDVALDKPLRNRNLPVRVRRK